MAYLFPPAVREPLMAHILQQIVDEFDALLAPGDDLPFADNVDIFQLLKVVQRLCDARAFTRRRETYVRQWLAFDAHFGCLNATGQTLAMVYARARLFDSLQHS